MVQAPGKYDAYIADFQAFEEGEGASHPEWVRQLRQGSMATFSKLGFPVARRGNERWKYTNVGPIASATFEYPAVGHDSVPNEADVRRAAPWDPAWTTLVFLDGLYCEALSQPGIGTGTTVAVSLRHALLSDGDLAQRHLGRYAQADDDAFVALNTAFLRDGALVTVPRGTSAGTPVHLLYLTTAQATPTASYPRALVVAEEGSRLTIVESYVGLSGAPTLTDAVTEMVLEPGAQVEHYRLLWDPAQSYHVGVTRVHQGEGSSFTSGCFARGTALARNDLSVVLDAPDSSCTLHGLYTTLDRQHIDNYINIDHAKPHTTSKLYYKGILDGKSKAVFGGTVLVRRDAQKSIAHQQDKNLILSDAAEVDSKPSLLIYADDVQCGHGATAGHLDEDSLFYMRSRGLDEDTAMGLLVQAFASEIVDTVQLESLRRYLERSFTGGLPGCQYVETP